MIVGIDHGYYAIKTKHVSFPSGIIQYDYEPYTMQNVLQYQGKYYVCGTGRQTLVKNKTSNDNYYLLTLAACGNSSTANQPNSTNAEILLENESEDSDSSQSDGKVLVAYFAYSENIGDTSDMEIDAVSSASLNRKTSNEAGNLQIMAKVIEKEKGADVFHILTKEPYDPDYSTMLPVAIEQIENEEWPALQDKIENLDDYQVIYLGTPVWDASLPPAMHTFFEENDLSGKTIIPFGIHLGSGFGRMIDEMKELAPQATIAEGFTINASTANDKVETEFREWLMDR